MLRSQLATTEIDAIISNVASSFFARHMGAAWRFPLGVTPPCGLPPINDDKFIHASVFFTGTYEGTTELIIPFSGANFLFNRFKQIIFSSSYIANNPLLCFVGFILTELTSEIVNRLNNSEIQARDLIPVITLCNKIKFYEQAADRNTIFMGIENVPIILTASICSNKFPY